MLENEPGSSVRASVVLLHLSHLSSPLNETATFSLYYISCELFHFRLLIDPEVDVELSAPPKAYE